MYDAIGSVNGRGVTLEQARELLPPINGTSVVSAIHRLSIAGALTLQRRGKTIIYCATPGAHPTDKRGRPRIAATPRRERRAGSSVNQTRAAYTHPLGNVPAP